MSKLRYELRVEMRTVLARLDKRWIHAASHDLCERLSDLVNSKLGDRVHHILAWTSFFPGEVDLSGFISQQLGKREVYLPRVLADRTMTFIQVEKNWMNSTEAGAYGIPGPRSDAGSAYDTSWAEETVVIVPGLAFDREGNRLGRGKGYYNNFLRPPMTRSIKIGVCWELQVVMGVQSDADHVLMDWVCNEREALQTGALFEEELA